MSPSEGSVYSCVIRKKNHAEIEYICVCVFEEVWNQLRCSKTAGTTTSPAGLICYFQKEHRGHLLRVLYVHQRPLYWESPTCFYFSETKKSLMVAGSKVVFFNHSSCKCLFRPGWSRFVAVRSATISQESTSILSEDEHEQLVVIELMVHVFCLQIEAWF